MVPIVWTEFYKWLMECLDPSFTDGFCNLTLITSFDEFGIFQHLQVFNVGFAFYPTLQFHLNSSFFLIWTMVTCELKPTSLVILSISTVHNVSIPFLFLFWLLWSICFYKLLVTTIDISISYHTFGFLNTNL